MGGGTVGQGWCGAQSLPMSEFLLGREARRRKKTEAGSERGEKEAAGEEDHGELEAERAEGKKRERRKSSPASSSITCSSKGEPAETHIPITNNQ